MPAASTSPFRGVHWDRYHECWSVEIEVARKRFKLGRFDDERDAARAYDIAAEFLGVPERRNFGAHDDYTHSKRVRPCYKCKGLGLVGGEYQVSAGMNHHMKFITRIGQWKDCPQCEGAGYFIQDLLVFEKSDPASAGGENL